MSNTEVPVVIVRPEKHPNADNLGICKVWGYQIVTKNEDFPIGETTRGVYIPPDFIVPDTAMFNWLAGHRRIKTRKFRGERSEGIIIPCPDPVWSIGKNVIHDMGIEKWESPADRAGYDRDGQEKQKKLPWWNWKRYYWAWQRWSAKRTQKKAKPPFHVSEYDVEAYKRYPVLELGETVVITEKIHGANARFVYSSRTRQLHIGSHTQWKPRYLPCWWTHCVEQNPWLEKLCKDNPDVVFYGEIFGASVQPLDYGLGKGRFGVRLFDIKEGNGEWASWERIEKFWFQDLRVKNNWVPILYHGVWNEKIGDIYTGGQSTIGKHLREGIVVEPVVPRHMPEVGRVKLKLINPDYYDMKINERGQEQYKKEKP